ncbi:hypothetical protein K523DRAFT_195730, partial [Schizophyllum commune Tattone D]
LREAISKVCADSPETWPSKLPLALFADRITVSSVTGFSPYQLLHGTDPILPMDLAESTFMVQGFKLGMSTSDLLALRIRQLERLKTDVQRAAKTLHKARFISKGQFERRFQKKLLSEDYKPGQLVLLRNQTAENKISAEAKVASRFLGPYAVVRRNRGGAYILCELDGSILSGAAAPRRLLPY